MSDRTSSFEKKKQVILQELSKPSESYSDLSPKGAIDEEIHGLVDEINSYEGFVTTSSCSGRISVFAEGSKACFVNAKDGSRPSGPSSKSTVEKRTNIASKGGKGGGGKWLYVSHKPLVISPGDVHTNCMELFGLVSNDSIRTPQLIASSERLIHFKFEPMILHILTASAKEAHLVLAAAHEAGFRESGAANIPVDWLKPRTGGSPIPVAIRTTGLGFDNIIGYVAENVADSSETEVHQGIISEAYLRMLVEVANVKFEINRDRTSQFRELLAARIHNSTALSAWEDGDARRERKKREGLKAKKALRRQQHTQETQGSERDANCEWDGDTTLGAFLE